MQFFCQVPHIPFSEGDAAVSDDIGILRDIGADHRVSIGEGFQQAQGHPFHVGGKDVDIGVAVKLFQRPAGNEAGEEDVGIIACHSFQPRYVLVGIAAAADDDQLFLRFQIFVSFDQIVDAFFFRQPGQQQEVAVLFQTVCFCDKVRFPCLGAGDTVGDQGGFPSVGVQIVLLHTFAEDDDLIGPSHYHPFSEFDVFGSEAFLPFFPLPVQSVDRGHAAFSQKLWDPDGGAGAKGMEV